MTNPAKISSVANLELVDGGVINVQGVLNFDTVPLLAKQAAKLLSNMSEAQVSFAGVDNSNSAGLALILEMTRTMQKNKKQISFIDMPEQILIMARAYGVDEELNAILNSSL